MNNDLEKTLKKFEQKDLCGKTPFINRLVPHFMEKARHNILFSSAVLDLSNKEDAKKVLNLPETFTAFDWVVVTAYYAMYHAALAALASISYKSSLHTATIIAIEVYFVKKKLLEKEFLEKLKQAREFEEEYVQKFRYARRQRETAQYSVTDETGKEVAERLVKDAQKFVNRIEKLLEDLESSPEI